MGRPGLYPSECSHKTWNQSKVGLISPCKLYSPEGLRHRGNIGEGTYILLIILLLADVCMIQCTSTDYQQCRINLTPRYSLIHNINCKSSLPHEFPLIQNRARDSPFSCCIMSDKLIKEPLQLSGILDQYDFFDSTPIIGREFPTANLKEWLRAANSDALLRDLAITVSQRGVVFFRKQDDMDDNLQKELAQRLGELSGKPKTSGLHINPVLNSGREMGGSDDRISVLSRKMERTLWNQMVEPGLRQSATIEWHNDITFEACPSDYTVLRLTELPKCGGGQYIYPVSSIPMGSFHSN
jgi:Taurine catabolism dioxygenase TauD, TfdA family